MSPVTFHREGDFCLLASRRVTWVLVPSVIYGAVARRDAVSEELYNT